MDESEGLAQDLRSISGVEFAAVLKGIRPGKISGEFQAKRLGNVAEIAANLGGGGHLKAAGCTIKAPMARAEAMVEKEILKAIERLETDE